MSRKLQPHEKSFTICIVIGLLLMLLPCIYFTPDYEELTETEIVVKRVGWTTGRHFWDRNYFLVTADGETIVTYPGDKQTSKQVIFFIIGMIPITIGFLDYNSKSKFIKKYLKKRAKRKKTK